MSIAGSEPPTEKPDGAGTIVTSGLPGHERPVPGRDIPPTTENVRPGFVAAFAFAQLSRSRRSSGLRSSPSAAATTTPSCI